MGIKIRATTDWHDGDPTTIWRVGGPGATYEWLWAQGLSVGFPPAAISVTAGGGEGPELVLHDYRAPTPDLIEEVRNRIVGAIERLNKEYRQLAAESGDISWIDRLPVL